ncbi:MAG TPA: alpha-amylase/4-alpha-glucanotransferase domain-containing protein [Candidatus Limnocylindrales bacterium]|nr:alpha-amylase/4-alpha-glucanotransferase domain-containing protein [Candidatus Limnocylindrales bacterium]
MSRRIALALTLHNHQPVGNFGWVIEETHRHAYLPMVEALERHPQVRLGLHYTGPLLEWLGVEHPDFLDRLRALVARGQVEILGGGYFEPVLASLPERDRLSQLTRMADEVERLFGRRPTAAWLAERVWEPDLPTSLAGAGYQSTIVDDAHFRAASIPEDAMWGPYTTEDQGRLLIVFGTEQGLRYRIPFRQVDDVIAYLWDHATEDGGRLGTMGDDGEKFGAWPSTWKHCWGEERWVDRFFEALEANAGWLTTTTPSDWLAANGPLGRVYIPVGSYAEMGEWALPAGEGRAFHDALERARAEGRPEARWLRGASWRNFQVKYREINDLHKRMLRVSEKVAAMPAGPARDAAHDDLLRGQSNDVYWHGLFGGIYLPHLRLATVAHLVAAEDAADRALGTWRGSEVRDLDLDGRDEVRLAADGQVVTIDLDEGAGIGDWDIRAARHALGSVLRRRPEAYHETLRRSTDTSEAAASGDGGALASIHDIVRSKEAGLVDRLRYDDHERRSALIRFLPADCTAAEYGAGESPDIGSALAAPQRVVDIGEAGLVTEGRAVVWTPDGDRAVDVRKAVELGGGRLDPSLTVRVTVTNRSDGPIRCRVGQEWAITMLGGGGNPSAWYEVGESRRSHDGSGTADGVARIAQGNDWVGVTLESRPSPAADAWWAPIETVSNSEDGFERVYQGSSLLLSWPLDLAPGTAATFSVEQQVTVARDRAAS